MRSNAAATAGEWSRVDPRSSQPLLGAQLAAADLAEAHRLAGLAAYFQQRALVAADPHFLAYLRDRSRWRTSIRSLYPPEVVTFFQRRQMSSTRAELRARRPKAQALLRYCILIPPGGQFQNGDRTKAYVIGGLLGSVRDGESSPPSRPAFVVHRAGAANGGSSATCDEGNDRPGKRGLSCGA